MIQHSIEMTYEQFKKRVADGRKKDTAYIETIAKESMDRKRCDHKWSDRPVWWITGCS
jgi:hypothetical protein